MRTAAAGLTVALVLVWAGTDLTGRHEQDSQQLPRFRSGVDIVTLDVTVLDRDRKPIKGLTAADFTVLEDGQRKDIVSFDEVVVPDPETPPAPWLRDVAPDVRTNNVEPEGRLLIIVMDDATLPPTQEFVQHGKRIARRIIELMGPSDLAAVVFTMNNRYAQDFTSDRQRLFAAIDKFTHGFALDIIARLPDGGVVLRDPFLENSYTIKTLKAAADYLRAIPQRRKAIVYVSVGIPVDPAEPVSTLGVEAGAVAKAELSASMLHYMRDAFGSALVSNVNIYAVDPGGLGGLESFLKARRLPQDPRLFREYLQTMSENTGGFAIVEANDPAEEVKRILVETGSYYLVGYRTDPREDGRFRRIQVRVNRPGASARTRNGYYAQKPGAASSTAGDPPPPPLLTAMSGFLPKGDVPMQVTAAPFAIPGRKESALAIVARVRQPAVTARTVREVELLTRAFDPQGKSKGEWSQMARVVLLPTDATEAEYEVLSRVDLKPGRYQLRIAAHNPKLEKSGSVYYDVDVPDFSKDGLWLSGVVLSTKPGLPAAPRDALAALLPVVPTTVREYEKDDEVSAFLRVYQRPKDAQVVAITTRVLDQEGAEIAAVADQVNAEMFAATGAAEYRFRLPLERLSAGPHLLTIEARAGGQTVRRDVRFARR